MDVNYIKNKFCQHGSETPFFTLNGVTDYARVIEVYDGDTITIVMKVHETFLKFKCRLMDIDTCEIRSNNDKNKELGLKARNRLIQLITDKQVDEISSKKEISSFLEDDVYIIYVHCFGYDKYGRVLVHCYKNNDMNAKSFSHILVEEKLAYFYQGDKKLNDEQQIKALK